jgi:hypothetical protein
MIVAVAALRAVENRKEPLAVGPNSSVRLNKFI